MKRIFSYLAACATMFALAACQEKPIEQPVVETPEVEVEYQDVTFSVAAPSGPQTRTSYGETVTFPTELHVAVYVAEGNENKEKEGTWLKDVMSVIVPKAEGEGVINTEWEVTISLVKNYSYDIVFWAQKKDSDYYAINWEARTITADYEVAANDVTRDAFYHVAKGYNYITATEDDARIQLTRPFAQINLGASDYAALIEHSGFVNGTADPDLHTTITSVTATIPNVLNVLTSKATGTADVKFTVAPTTELVNKVNDIEVKGTNAAGVQETMNYKLVGSNYIFANPYKENNPTVELDLTFAYNGKSFDLNVPNVPYARNYQTNILGNFFTSNSKFNVVIVPGFNTIPGDEYVHVWDGYSVSEPTKGTEGYMITTGAELAWVAQQVNTGAKDFAGETVIIAEEIRLAGYPWTPIGNDQYPFKGTIKSLDIPVKSAAEAHYSISGLYVKRAEGPAGLFGVLNGTASNLTFDAPEVYGTEYVGTVAGKIFPEGLIEGVAINGGKVTGNHYVGGAVGYAYGSVKNSAVDGVKVSGVYVDEDLDGAKIGGVIGFHPIDADDTEVSDNVVKSLEITGESEVGAVAGAANAKNIKDNNVKSATIVADTYAAVVVGHVFNDEGEDAILDPKANTYAHDQIYVNGEQAAPAKYFELKYNPEVTLIPAEGGEITIEIVSNVNKWSVTAPEGVKVEPAEGKETADVVFTFPENKSIKPVTYELVFENKDKGCAIINYMIPVTQEAAQPTGPVVVTVAEFLAAEVGDTEYQLTGVIEGTYNTQYGNFYLNDGTAKVQVYGLTATKVEYNDKSFASLGLRDGDTVTLIGTRDVHNDKPQVGGPAYYVSHVAAPFLELAAGSATIDAEATEYKITVESNTAWTAAGSEGVTLDVNSGEGNAEVTMTVPANTANEAVTYTVTFTYGEKTATFTLTQKGVPASDEPVIIFEETFAKCTGTMGWSGSVANGTFAADNENWTVANAFGANGVAKFGAGSKLGTAETPALNITGTATLKFKAGAWSGDATTLKLSMTNGTLSATSVTMKSGDWTEYEITITNATEGAKIKFEGKQTSKARFFLDDIVITQ